MVTHSAAQPGRPRHKQVGRYQMEIIPPRANSTTKYVMVIDTATGRVWQRQLNKNNAKWKDLGSPAVMVE